MVDQSSCDFPVNLRLFSRPDRSLTLYLPSPRRYEESRNAVCGAAVAAQLFHYVGGLLQKWFVEH